MSKLNIRLEEAKDYFEVENLTREAFWNIYRPGCFEHLVIHKLRNDESFVKELDYVIEKDKYRKMLATIHKDAYRKYFDEAIDLYNAATEKLESDIKKSMSLDADSDTKQMSYSDQKILQSFIGDIKSNLINFAAQFRRNNAQYLVMYADFLKRNLEKYRQPVKDILSKYN